MKLISESLLSLYPIFIKKIPTSMDNQLLSRLIGYSVIPILFMSLAELKKNLIQKRNDFIASYIYTHLIFL